MGTDENKVSQSCIPAEVMQLKQRGSFYWLVPLLLLGVCMCCTLCSLCCACVCCICHCFSGRPTTPDDHGICVCVCGSPCCFVDFRYNLPGLIARRLAPSKRRVRPLASNYALIDE